MRRTVAPVGHIRPWIVTQCLSTCKGRKNFDEKIQSKREDRYTNSRVPKSPHIQRSRLDQEVRWLFDASLSILTLLGIVRMYSIADVANLTGTRFNDQPSGLYRRGIAQVLFPDRLRIGPA